MSKPKFTSTAGPVGRPGGGRLRKRYAARPQRNRAYRRAVAGLYAEFAAWRSSLAVLPAEYPGGREKMAAAQKWAQSYLPARGTE